MWEFSILIATKLSNNAISIRHFVKSSSFLSKYNLSTLPENNCFIVLIIQVTFQPQSVNEESVDYLHVHPVGKVSKMVVKLVGKCTGKYALLLLIVTIIITFL